MARILICDDDDKVVELIKTYCELDNYETDTASDGLDAIMLTKEKEYDLIILDVMMPKLDGFTALEKIREYSSVPVIMLTAKSEEHDKLQGFTAGADDFLAKPFSPRELMARIKAIIKRNTKEEDLDEIVEISGIKVNPLSREVFVNDEIVTLTPKEFDLLLFLMRNKRQVMTREQLLDKVWGYDYYGDARTVDTHVKSLRERLGEKRGVIKTVWGVGYKFED